MSTVMPEAPTDWSKVESMSSDDPRYAHDSKLYVQFYLRPILMETASAEANRPVFKDIEHVRIMIPGDKLNIIDRIASTDDKQRFATHYAKFKAGQGTEIIGTRLEAAPWMTRSKVEEYKFFNIHTVEQLAGANDEVGHRFPSFHSDRDRARKFLEQASGTDSRVAELEKQLAELQAKIAAQGSAEKGEAAPAATQPVKK